MTELYLTKTNGTKYNITGAIEKVVWSGDFKSVSRKLEFDMVKNKDVTVSCGDIVSYYIESKKIFEGIVFKNGNDSSTITTDLLAYDKGIYILKNKLSYNFKETKAEDIAKKVAVDLGIQVGNIVATNISITKLFPGVSAYEIIMTAYTEASKKTGKKYMSYIKDDKLFVEEKGNIKLSIGFEEGKNLENTRTENSIENMINRVVVTDENNNKKYEVKNDEWIKLYGSIQDIIQVQEDKDYKQEASDALKGKETNCSLSGYGDVSCITGYGVQVKDNDTGLVGLFYIDTDTHTWQNGEYKIELDISLQNIMDEVTAGQDESETEENSSDTSSSSSSSSSASDKANKAVEYARGKIGKPYVWGATGPNSFDCSGLTSWCYKQVGISIPRTSREQSTFGTSISKSNLQPGDLVFFDTKGGGYVSHVGMYIGNGNMIHAPKPGDSVKIVSINSSYYTKAWKGARRVA